MSVFDEYYNYSAPILLTKEGLKLSSFSNLTLKASKLRHTNAKIRNFKFAKFLCFVSAGRFFRNRFLEVRTWMYIHSLKHRTVWLVYSVSSRRGAQAYIGRTSERVAKYRIRCLWIENFKQIPLFGFNVDFLATGGDRRTLMGLNES